MDVLQQLSGPLLIRMIHTKDGAKLGVTCVFAGSRKVLDNERRVEREGWICIDIYKAKITYKTIRVHQRTSSMYIIQGII